MLFWTNLTGLRMVVVLVEGGPPTGLADTYKIRLYSGNCVRLSIFPTLVSLFAS